MPLQVILNPIAYARLAAQRLHRVNKTKPVLRSQKHGGAEMKGQDEQAARDQAEARKRLNRKL